MSGWFCIIQHFFRTTTLLHSHNTHQKATNSKSLALFSSPSMSCNNLFCLHDDDDDVPLMTFFQWSDKTANPATLPLLLVLVLRLESAWRGLLLPFFNGAGSTTTTTTPPPRSSRAPLNKTLNTKYLPFSRSHLLTYFPANSCSFLVVFVRGRIFPRAKSERVSKQLFRLAGRVFPHPVCVQHCWPADFLGQFSTSRRVAVSRVCSTVCRSAFPLYCWGEKVKEFLKGWNVLIVRFWIGCWWKVWGWKSFSLERLGKTRCELMKICRKNLYE